MKNQSSEQRGFNCSSKRIIRVLFVLALMFSVLYEASSITPPKETVYAEGSNNTQYKNLHAGFVSSIYDYADNNTKSDDTNIDTPSLQAGVSEMLYDTLNKVTEETEVKTPTSGVISVFSNNLRKVAMIEKNNIDNVSSGYTEEEPVEVVNYSCEINGYTTNNVNVRTKPNTESEVIKVLPWNSHILYAVYDDDWVVINNEDGYAYISRAYISDIEITSTVMDVYGDSRKSYMDWHTITDRSSEQWLIQQDYAYTEANGVRVAKGRYCIALGSYYTHTKGQYVDLILENGVVIPCVIGDCKDNKDTRNNYSIGADGGVAEFIVDESSLSYETKLHGSVSFATPGWKANVVQIRIYDKNLFDQ